MGRKFTQKQLAILDCWISGVSIADTVIVVGCSKSMVTKTRLDEDIKQLYYKAQSDKIKNMIPAALKQLERLVTSEKVQDGVKLGAIREVLERAKIAELAGEDTNNALQVLVSYE